MMQNDDDDKADKKESKDEPIASFSFPNDNISCANCGGEIKDTNIQTYIPGEGNLNESSKIDFCNYDCFNKKGFKSLKKK